MDKKTIVVSGGSGYLGSAVSRVLEDAGFRVIIFDKDAVDISDEAAVRKAAEEVQEKWGKVFAVIHAASMPLVRKPVLALSEEDFEKQFSVNVLGAFHLFKYLSAALEQEGAIIGITSSILFSGTNYPKSGSYAAAKFGLQGLLKTIAAENPFRVYSVAPSFMPGGLNADLPGVIRDAIVYKMGAEKTTDPNAAAEVVLSLVNDTGKKWSGKTVSMPGFSISPL